MMKAISLWQPWASAMVADETIEGDRVRPKTIETRSWLTSYRGPLVICAAKKWNGELAEIASGLFDDVLHGWKDPHERADASGYQSVIAGGSSLHYPTQPTWSLPLGCALGVVDLVDCVPTRSLHGQVPEWEWALGNYEPGRFGWKTANLRRFRKPIPIKGAQGLFEISGDALVPINIELALHAI